MSLEIRNLSYAVGQFQFSEINLAITDKTYFILLGPTGSGKSNLLKGFQDSQSTCHSCHPQL